MSDVFSVLPTRPLHARPPSNVVGAVRSVIGVLMFGAMLIACLVWVAPELYTDWEVRDKAVPLRGAHLKDGSCSSQIVFHICDATLTVPAGPNGTVLSRTVHYVFASFNLGDFTAQVVGDPQRPELVTTDLGLDHFYDRIVSLLLACALLGGFVVAAAVQMIRARRVRASWRRAALMPVPLQLTALKRAGNNAVWTVRAENGRTAQWNMPRRAKPFVLGPADRVLGLATQGAGSIMPLDAKLRWVDLSREERGAALAAAQG